jgi:hypothetical protein
MVQILRYLAVGSIMIAFDNGWRLLIGNEAPIDARIASAIFMAALCAVIIKIRGGAVIANNCD